MPSIEAHLFDRIRLLEARVAALERERDSSPERSAIPGAFGTLAFCKSNAILAPGSSAQFSIYRESNTGPLEDTGTDAEVWAPPYLLSPLSLAAEKWGIMLRLLKRLWWIGGECPE